MVKHKKHFVGSTFWIIFWIIFFFPIAIIYWAVRQEELSEKELKKLEERSWIKKHKIFSGIMAFFLLLIGMSLLANVVDSDSVNNNLEEGKLISVDSASLLPQDVEIDREWRLKDIEDLIIDSNGFVEGSELQISKTESFSGTTVIMKVFRFDSVENAQNYYNQEVESINIRGVKELKLSDNCFGIENDIGLSGSAQGYCLRNNIVIYIKSAGSSFMYASDLKDFQKIILKKI